jgi:hypothetical protein
LWVGTTNRGFLWNDNYGGYSITTGNGKLVRIRQ